MPELQHFMMEARLQVYNHVGETEPQHARAVFGYLIDCANQLRIVTHGEIAENCGGSSIGVGHILGWIRENVCRPRGLPFLTIISVSKKTQCPGDGYFGIPELQGKGEQFQENEWKGRVQEVFAYDWSQVEFDEEDD